jgi:hypothetical protein
MGREGEESNPKLVALVETATFDQNDILTEKDEPPR